MATRTPDTSHLVFGAILVYTAFHFAVFALLGMGLVVLVHWGVRDSVVRYALLPVFLVFEVMFYGLLEVFSERTNELFPFWAVVAPTLWPRSVWGSISGSATRISGAPPGHPAGRRSSLTEE